MKTMKRLTAALLAVLLLAGIFPVIATAQEQEPEQETVRTSVMIGADGLIESDTLVLGYAKPDAAVTGYPLEWQVLSADKDSQGREGGKLLVSKYLLPAVQTAENGGLDMSALSGIFMPESYTVLPTTLSDAAYVANLNANIISDYKDGKVSYAGLYTQRADDALTAANFFALSAEEAEHYFANSDEKRTENNKNDLLRRPYAAGYAIKDAGSRSWALRSLSKTGKTTAVVPAFSDEKRLAQVGGLIAAEEAEFSRPAFNLRSNAITFVYQTKVDQTAVSLAGTVTPNETRPQIVDAAVTATKTVTGTGQWRAALHALPALQLEARYCNDGSFVLTPPPGVDYPIGVLETSADGTVISWGVARGDKFGVFTFTPDEGVTDLYFYSFEYDTVSGQLYTSNLVHVGAGAATAMTLGAGHLRNGDTVMYGNKELYVVDADKASAARGAKGSNITRDEIYSSEYPIWNNEAVFLATKLPGYSMTYKHSSFDLSKAQDDYFDLVYEYHTLPSSSTLLQNEYDRIVREAAAGVAEANAANKKGMPSFDANDPEQFTVDYRFVDSIAYTWINDKLTGVSGPATFTYQQEENRAVNGKRYFLLSASEYLSADAKTRSGLGATLLRSHIQENFSMTMKPQIETVSYPSAASGNRAITVNDSSDVSGVGAALGFNLWRDHIVFMFQQDSVNEDIVSASALPDVPAYDETNDVWRIAVLEPDIHLSKAEYATSPTQNPTIGISGAKWLMAGGGASYLSLLVTDGAGNVKKYGQIADTSDYPENSEISVELDVTSLDYGDRVYAVNEHHFLSSGGLTVCASEPLLIYEQKLAGEVNFSQSDYLLGETVVADLSKITVSGCETLSNTWYAFRGVEENIESGSVWTADGTDQTVTFGVKCGAYGVKADLNVAEGVLMAYNGAHEQDDFAGDTLYYGEKGADNYTWTVIGRQTGGVAEVRDHSNTAVLAKELNTDNVLVMMRNDLTVLGDLKVSGYMTHGVLESDLSDARTSINVLNFNAGSEENVLSFRPSVNDYLKLTDLGKETVIFASAPSSDTEGNWDLRNASTLSRYGVVDALQQLQVKKRTQPSNTRESINVNNKDIVFYTPADKALTYNELSGYRADSVDEWKLTVYQPNCISYDRFVTKRNGSTVTAECSFYDADASRYVTAWAEKDGELVWLDSRPTAAADEYHETFTIPEGIVFDETYAVLRRDNGAYHTDVCTLPQSTEPTEVLVEIYCNGERTDEGCWYSLYGDISGSGSMFYCGENVFVSAGADPANIFDIGNMTVTFDDGTVERIQNTHLPADNADMQFAVRGENPVVRIYLQTQAYNIYTEAVTYNENNETVSEPENKITAPLTARGGSTYTFTVACKEGYYIDTIRVDNKTVPNTNPVMVLQVAGDTAVKIPAYAPGSYTAKMPLGVHSYIVVEYRKLPEFSLTLLAIPPEGGEITASYEGTVSAGTEVTVFPQTNEGWELTGVTMQPEDGELQTLECGENGYQFSMPPKATTVTAYFAKYCEIPVEVYVDGKLSDTGCTWALTDAEGQSSETFLQGQTVHIEAAPDTGYIFDRAELSDNGTTVLQTGGEVLSTDFTFSGTEPCIKIYLRTQTTNITIACQTLDESGEVMENIGGEVDAPTEPVNYNELYLYAALANEGYYVESITANGAPVENPAPKTIEVGGKEITAYPSGDYEACGTTEDVAYFITFRKLPALSVTSHFMDVSNGTPTPVTDASVVYTVDGKERTVFYPGEEITATVSCEGNYAIVSTDTTPETVLTQTDKYTFTFTMPGSSLDVTYNLKKLAIRSAYLHVNEDINLIYTVQIPEGFTDPKATFAFMGKSYEVSDYGIGADGRYHFEFENVTPQYMGEPVDVTVTATCGGKTYSHTNTGYSVQKYCVNMLGKTDDGLLKTLLSDILVYGEKAQRYTNYKTDALVTEGVDLSAASTYPGLSGLHEKFIGTADEDVFWNAASLSLSNNVSLVLKFHASDIEGLSVTATIDGRTETFTEFTPVEGIEGFYTVSFRGIYATEFDSPVLTSFYRDGEQIGNTLQYSVNIYICKKQDDADQVFANLVKALYNYGASSLKYYQERMRNE